MLRIIFRIVFFPSHEAFLQTTALKINTNPNNSKITVFFFFFGTFTTKTRSRVLGFLRFDVADVADDFSVPERGCTACGCWRSKAS